MKKKIEIEIILVDMFKRIGIDSPDNFDNILDYIYDDVCETADKDNWHDGDVMIAFRRWIESN